jgi:hypothetical protein
MNKKHDVKKWKQKDGGVAEPVIWKTVNERAI